MEFGESRFFFPVESMNCLVSRQCSKDCEHSKYIEIMRNDGDYWIIFSSIYQKCGIVQVKEPLNLVFVEGRYNNNDCGLKLIIFRKEPKLGFENQRQFDRSDLKREIEITFKETSNRNDILRLFSRYHDIKRGGYSKHNRYYKKRLKENVRDIVHNLLEEEGGRKKLKEIYEKRLSDYQEIDRLVWLRNCIVEKPNESNDKSGVEYLMLKEYINNRRTYQTLKDYLRSHRLEDLQKEVFRKRSGFHPLVSEKLSKILDDHNVLNALGRDLEFFLRPKSNWQVPSDLYSRSGPVRFEDRYPYTHDKNAMIPVTKYLLIRKLMKHGHYPAPLDYYCERLRVLWDLECCRNNFISLLLYDCELKKLYEGVQSGVSVLPFVMRGLVFENETYRRKFFYSSDRLSRFLENEVRRRVAGGVLDLDVKMVHSIFKSKKRSLMQYGKDYGIWRGFQERRLPFGDVHAYLLVAGKIGFHLQKTGVVRVTGRVFDTKFMNVAAIDCTSWWFTNKENLMNDMLDLSSFAVMTNIQVKYSQNSVGKIVVIKKRRELEKNCQEFTIEQLGKINGMREFDSVVEHYLRKVLRRGSVFHPLLSARLVELYRVHLDEEVFSDHVTYLKENGFSGTAGSVCFSDHKRLSELYQVLKLFLSRGEHLLFKGFDYAMHLNESSIANESCPFPKSWTRAKKSGAVSIITPSNMRKVGRQSRRVRRPNLGMHLVVPKLRKDEVVGSAQTVEKLERKIVSQETEMIALKKLVTNQGQRCRNLEAVVRKLCGIVENQKTEMSTWKSQNKKLHFQLGEVTKILTDQNVEIMQLRNDVYGGGT